MDDDHTEGKFARLLLCLSSHPPLRQLSDPPPLRRRSPSIASAASPAQHAETSTIRVERTRIGARLHRVGQPQQHERLGHHRAPSCRLDILFSSRQTEKYEQAGEHRRNNQALPFYPLHLLASHRHNEPSLEHCRGRVVPVPPPIPQPPAGCTRPS